MVDPPLFSWKAKRISSEIRRLYNYVDCSQISKDEVAKIVAGFENESLLTSGGVTIAGARYIYLSGTDRIIRAKLGKVGVHCMKTQQGEFTPLFH